jgi:hypothetical protein
MEGAAKSVADGHPAVAARAYQSLALRGQDEADNAAAALKSLVENPDARVPLGEEAGVFEAAAQVARRGRQGSLDRADVAARAMALAAARGSADPRDALAVLDAARPLMIDTRPLDAARLPLLRAWAAAEPSNLAAIVPLAAALIDGPPDKAAAAQAKALLTPVRDRLGDGDGARVLGTILANDGDYDGAYALLWPYVKSRLDRLHAAEQAAESTAKRIQDREVDRLDKHQGPDDFYSKYAAASTDGKRALVIQYVTDRVKADPQYAGAQEALEHEAAVVPVALDLGIVMLQRAQQQADPAARKSQLESAERVFLAVGGVAGESDAYRMSLGQVYYWLGKQADGRKLFDEYLAAKGRAVDALAAIAGKLRLVGAEPDARAMAEEAYGKATKEEDRHAVAQLRSACFKDLDDQINWLAKADGSSPYIKATLAKATGDRDFQAGRDDDAARQYRAAIDAYAAMPRGASSLNQGALAQYALFQVTGDRQALDRCLDQFQQAVDLEPSDAILLYNAGVTLLDGALADVIGPTVDLRALHQHGDVGTLGYLYADAAGRAQIVARVRQHPGVARALTFLDKVIVLAPKNARAFNAVAGLHQFTRDEAAIAALDARVRAAQVDAGDEVAQAREHLTGVKDARDRETLVSMLKRGEDLAAGLRAKGGPTAAVALDAVAVRLIALDALAASKDTVDLSRAVDVAEEAVKLAPSTNSRGVAMQARLARAVRQLRRTDPAFDAHCQKYLRPLSAHYLVASAVAEPGPFRQALLAHPDVRRAAELLREQLVAFPDDPSISYWPLLKAVDPGAADALAAAARKTPRLLAEQSIATQLRPADAAEALETYWLMQMHNRPQDAREAVRRITALGIPMPVAQ